MGSEHGKNTTTYLAHFTILCRSALTNSCSFSILVVRMSCVGSVTNPWKLCKTQTHNHLQILWKEYKSVLLLSTHVCRNGSPMINIHLDHETAPDFRHIWLSHSMIFVSFCRVYPESYHTLPWSKDGAIAHLSFALSTKSQETISLITRRNNSAENLDNQITVHLAYYPYTNFTRCRSFKQYVLY